MDWGHEDDARAARWLFCASAVVAVLVVAYAITRPLTWLVRVVPDDTFYYLKIATTIVREGRSSFDGVNPADGYHPGWMLIVVVLAELVHGKLALLRACLGTALLLHLASGYCLTRFFRRWMSAEWSWIGGACWLLNPLPVLLVVEGMEGSLYVLALTFALWVYITRIAPHLEKRSIPFWDMFSLGVSFGLCILARTDAVVLCAVASMGLMWKLSPRGAIRFAGATGAATVLCVVPWLAYCRSVGGAWLQHSGSMKMLWAQKEHTAGVAAALRYVTGDWLTFPLWAKTFDRLGHRWPLPRCAAGGILTLALLAALWRGRSRRDTRALAEAGLVLMAGTLLTATIYGLFFTDHQDWYRAQPGLILYVVLFGVIVRGVLDDRSDGRSAVALGGAAAAISAMVLVPVVVTANSYPWQRDVLESQPAFERLVPEGLPIGCFNAGIPAYFSERRIVNLDGLVNSTVYPYYRRNQLDRYLRDADIRYIADEDMSLVRANLFTEAPIPLQSLAAVPLTWMPEVKRHLWRVEFH